MVVWGFTAFEHSNSGRIMPEIVYSLLVNKANGVYKGNYSFKINIMEEIFEIRSCTEILADDIKIYTNDQYIFHSNVNKGCPPSWLPTNRNKRSANVL